MAPSKSSAVSLMAAQRAASPMAQMQAAADAKRAATAAALAAKVAQYKQPSLLDVKKAEQAKKELEKKLIKVAVPLALEQVNAGVPADEACKNAANTVVNATPPGPTADQVAAAEAMKSADSFYAQNPGLFTNFPRITPDAWATLTLGQKSDAIRLAIEMRDAPKMYPVQTPPEPQYVPSRPAETTVIQTTTSQQQEAAAMAEVDAFYVQNQAFFAQRGYTADKWSLMSLGQKTEAINKATSGTLPGSNPISVDPSETPAPPTADTVAVTYDLQVEGANAGSFAKLEDAVNAAVAATIPGDRFEIFYNGKTSGLRIRTTTGSVDVPADIDAQVRLLSRDKMGQFVVDAETKTAATGGGIPWWLLPIAAAGVVAAKVL